MTFCARALSEGLPAQAAPSLAMYGDQASLRASFMTDAMWFAWLLRPAVKTLTSRNDGVARSLPASTLVGGRIGVDLDERGLNSILKGRTVERIGPLGMIGTLICRRNS